jgi:alkylhydroperoxidase/carboxymuconolactone decarboxylase family protein YurZ
MTNVLILGANGGIARVAIDLFLEKTDARIRELITLSILIALGGCDSQVKGHIRGNVNVGNARDVLLDVVTQLLPWVGYPRTLNALTCLNEIAHCRFYRGREVSSESTGLTQ